MNPANGLREHLSPSGVGPGMALQGGPDQEAAGCQVAWPGRYASSAGNAGVTLMEVLIAIFILAVGLLGVAALLPVGGSETLEAIRADRSAAIGSAALSELHARRILEPFQWNTSTKQLVPMWYYNDQPLEDLVSNAPYGFLLIDPLGVAKAKEAGTLSQWTLFPKGVLLMPRVTVRATPWAPAPLTSTEAWNIFSTPERDTNGYPIPDYSWMVMISPLSPTQLASPWRVCSVIVFYKRILDFSSSTTEVPEWIVDLDTTPILTDEGGEIILKATDENLRPRLKSEHWLLLFSPKWCQWYRIVAAARPDNPTVSEDQKKWHVTVVGGPWPDDDNNPSTPPILPNKALLMEGVVGVFSQTVPIDFSRSKRVEIFGRK